MLNHSDDSIYIATYVQNYLDSIENLPDDVSRQLSRMRELDITYQGRLPIGLIIILCLIAYSN